MIGSGNTSTSNGPTQTTQGPTDEEQQKLNELIAQFSTVTFEESEIPSLAKKILSDEPEDLLHGLMGLRQLLSNKDDPPIQQVIDTNTVPRLVALLSQPSSTNILKVQAAWCLTNLCSGSTQQTQYCINNGIIPAFLALLKVDDPVEQSICGLGNIAGDNAKFRDIILHQNGVKLVVNALKNTSDVSLKRNGAWALMNFCKGKPSPNYSLVSGAIPLFADYLKNESDVKTLTHVAWGLSYVTFREQGVVSFLSHNAIPNLIQCLSSNDILMVKACLRTIGNIISGTEQHTSAVIKEKNFFPELFKLAVHPKKGIRSEVFWSISNITAGTPVQSEGIMSNPAYVEIIITAAKTDVPEVKKEAVWALSNSTVACTPAQIIRILNNGVFSCLVELLHEQDFKILQIALEGIQNCLKWGKQFHLNDENGQNKFIVEIENKSALNLLENLQSYESPEVSFLCAQILEEYFAGEELKA